MSYNFPFAIPTRIPGDINVRTSRITTIYPTETIGPYTTWKLPVLLATTANITLSGLPTIDGVEVAAGDRILVKNQSTASENGIYVVFSSDDATDGWLRANDLPMGSSAANMAVFVNQGTANADKMFLCTNNPGADTVGADSLVYIAYGDTSAVVPGDPDNSVQYNDAGEFAGSSLLTFDPTAYPFMSVFTAYGRLTIGPTDPDAVYDTGRIDTPNATAASGLSGTTLTIVAGNGDGVGDGGNTFLAGGISTGGDGGFVVVTGGDGSQGGNVSISGGIGSADTGGMASMRGGDGTSGGAVNLYGGNRNSGPDTGNGGTVTIASGDGGDLGSGGNVDITSGTAVAQSGNITLTADSDGTITGNIQLTTDAILTTFTKGGVQFTKDTSGALTIDDLATPPISVTSTSRQGIITIADPSALANDTSITITVNNVNVLASDTVYVCVQQFNTGGAGIPMVLVSSVTTSTSFTIQLYNIGAAPFSNSVMKIAFQMM